MSLPRLVVAAPATGQGKTTVSIGLMAALSRAGHVVSGHKVGPDYIDPGYHSLACGRPGRNLDPHLVGEERIMPLLLHGAAGADVAIIEGVMGLYDGRVGGHGFASTAHVAALTRSPVVLVVDISRSSRSIGAVVHGMATFDDSVEIAGVILNKAGSPRHAAEVASSIGLPVLGTIVRDDSFGVPSRHLGLVPAAERDEAAHTLDQLVRQITEVVDLDHVLKIAATAPDLEAQPWDPSTEVTRPTDRRPVVAMAGGRAFTFRYTETEELLRAAGCDVVAFDPLSDLALPRQTSGIYLGGGFPEVHVAALADNAPLRDDLRAAVDAGIPTVAECAGLLYLVDTLDGHPMVGAIDAAAAMTSRLTLRYPTAVAASDSLLGRVGEQVTGHEFHHTHTDPASGAAAAWTVDGQDVGFTGPGLHASYLHTHWAGHPQLAQRFVDAVHEAVPRSTAGVRRVEPREPALSAVAEPLRHHGDVEAAGLVDFAVNVFPGPPPTWLSTALRDSLERVGTYPDAAAASAAAAMRHGRSPEQALATAGAAEAFSLVARLRPWTHPVVIHPQFTEPHAALQQAGHRVTSILCTPHTGFVLDPAAVPDDADLVLVGNPTNPTGVLHPGETLQALLRPGRLVVVDEAFMDTVPGEVESLAARDLPGLLVLRSLTKHWGIPGVRAGYLLGEQATVAALRHAQVPWSVSTSACAAILACTAPAARIESEARTRQLVDWRRDLERALTDLGIEHVPSSASYVLARVGTGVHARLREAGVAVRRADTFPGLGPDWVRIAARPRHQTDLVVTALSNGLG